MSGLHVETFGCRLNAHESEAIRALATDAGLTEAVVVNTCAVTAEAVRQARQRIRRLRREHPGALMVVTGCAAQTEPAAFAAMPEVDRVIGAAAKLSPQTWAPQTLAEAPRVSVSDLFAPGVAPPAAPSAGFGVTARAQVQIQNGCDHRCTFCVIPYGRGPARSTPVGVVVEHVRRLVDEGWREVVLTGVDLTSWGGDLPGAPRLGDLVQRILRLAPDLPRLRLSSIDSVEVDAALIDALAEPRLMPHLHLSLQSGDDMILKRMKRRHNRDDAVRFCETARARRPEIVFGADLIAGFPTETPTMFENTASLIDACGLTWLHVFPFSARAGTPAARMPPTPGPARAERAARLRALGAARAAAHLRGRIGRTERALVEAPRLGRSETFAPVVFAADQPVAAVVEARIVAATDERLIAAATV